MIVRTLTAILAFSALTLLAADGEESYRTRCVLCHGGDGAGSDRARSILPTIHAKGPEELAPIITQGVASKGMPAFEMPAEELSLLIAYLKKLAANVPPAARDPRAPRPREGSLPLIDGGSLSGVILNESGFDAQCVRVTARFTCFGASRGAKQMRFARRRSSPTSTGRPITAATLRIGIARLIKFTAAMSASWRPAGSIRLKKCP